MLLSTYKDAAKRVQEHRESLRSVDTDFGVSTILRQFLCCWLLTIILSNDELFFVICVICDIGICSQMVSILLAYWAIKRSHVAVGKLHETSSVLKKNNKKLQVGYKATGLVFSLQLEKNTRRLPYSSIKNLFWIIAAVNMFWISCVFIVMFTLMIKLQSLFSLLHQKTNIPLRSICK